MIQQLFKYATCQTAEQILRNRTLRWSAPQLFNDPFEFKSPLEFGFEWEELMRPLLDEATRLVTQPEPPELLEDGPTTFQIRNDRIAYAASRRSLDDVRRGYEKTFAPLIDRLSRDDDYYYDQLWREFKREYRVLCFSGVANNILMWSHYADCHRGVVLAFEARFESRSGLAAAQPISYSKQVHTAASLEEFIGFLTSQRPKPIKEKALEKSAFTKGLEWDYEEEWRVLRKDTKGDGGSFSDWPFDPNELVAAYFGCRTAPEWNDKIMEAARSLPTPISFFQMRDERIRFELTPIRLG